VEIILFFITIVAPTCRLRHVERSATRWVIFIKYSSQLGLLITTPGKITNSPFLTVDKGKCHNY